MTPLRSRAYGCVMHMLEDLGPAKLQPEELETLREVADDLLFTNDGVEAERLLLVVQELMDMLVNADRWTQPTADRLIANLLNAAPAIPILA